MNISYDLDKYMGSFNFRISIDGVPQECSKVVSVQSVQTESELVEYQLGHEPFMRKIPGRNKFSEIEITRIYQGYDQFYNWRMMIEEGIDNLRTVNIEILAPDLNTVVRKMVLHNCWPSRWQLPNMDASSTEVAIETITLACERVTQDISVSLPGQTAAAPPPQIPGAGPLALTTASGDTQEFGDTAGGDGPVGGQGDALGLRAEALALSKLLGDGPLTTQELDWEPPEAVDDPTAEKNGGDGSGPIIKGNASNDSQEFADAVLGDGPIGGQGEAEEADYGDEGDGPLDPLAEPSTEADGTGPASDSTASGEAQEFGDTATGDGPIDNEKVDYGGSASADDPTAAKNGSDGSGPVMKGNASNDSQEFADTAGGSGPIGGQGKAEAADYGSGEGPIGGQGEAEEADYGAGDGPIDPSQKDFGESAAAEDPTAAKNGGDGDGPIDPSQKGFGASDAAEDPTAAKNGGDGSGPIGGQGEAAGADGGAGSGPIDNEKVDYGGSAAADDPTAAKNGGDGSGPVGGQGAAAEADYGSPGSGPIGGQGAPESSGE
jgi:phage tail-like protein